MDHPSPAPVPAQDTPRFPPCALSCFKIEAIIFLRDKVQAVAKTSGAEILFYFHVGVCISIVSYNIYGV